MRIASKTRYPHLFHALTAAALTVLVLAYPASSDVPQQVEQVESDEAGPPASTGTLVADLAGVVVGLYAIAYLIVAVALRTAGYRLLRQRPLRFEPWGIEDALVIVGGFFLLQIIAIGVASALGGGAMLVGIIVTELSGLGIGAIYFWIGRWKYGLLPYDLGLLFSRWKGDLGRAAALLLIVIAIQIPIGEMIARFYAEREKPVQPQQIVEHMSRTPLNWDFLVFALGASVAAPLWEETFFRGFLQPFLRRHIGAIAGILVTAGAFAWVHNQSQQLFFDAVIRLFPLALALGILRYRTQRLTPCIFLHALHNGLTVLFLTLVKV